MKIFGHIVIVCALFAVSCSPYLNYQPKQANGAAKPVEYNISIYHELDPLPPNSTTMGVLKVDNAVPSVASCSYDDIIHLAKWKTRKVGGDALQITNIKLPDDANSCYGITANIIAFDILENMFFDDDPDDFDRFRVDS